MGILVPSVQVHLPSSQVGNAFCDRRHLGRCFPHFRRQSSRFALYSALANRVRTRRFSCLICSRSIIQSKLLVQTIALKYSTQGGNRGQRLSQHHHW